MAKAQRRTAKAAMKNNVNSGWLIIKSVMAYQAKYKRRENGSAAITKMAK